MISRFPGSNALTLALVMRAAVVAALIWLAVRLLLTTQLYATTLVVVCLAAWVSADLVKAATRRQRDHDAQRGRSTARLAPLPLEERAGLQQQIDYRQALLDTVAAALIVVDDGGRVVLINHAALRLAAEDVHRLEQIAAIGPAGARRLLALAPGTRQVVPMADERQMFVSVSRFSAPDQAARRLICLQRIAGELDAVEVKAWQDMVHVLAHEMMNSLTPISSLSESLELLMQARQPTEAAAGAGTHVAWTNDDVAGALEAIKRRSRGLMDFVERYRQFAELPAPALQRLSLADLISGIERLLAETFRERHITYRSRVPPPDLHCCADGRLLEQAMINLLRNAVEAVSGTVDPLIEVCCRQQDGQIVLTVADNGRGLPPAARDRIFVPFFTTKKDGSGIGLSVARQVALAHGGQLDAWPNQPRGTVFALLLPITAAGSTEAD